MADINRIWDIQGFSGGESDDLTKGPKDCFYAGEGIEVRKDLSGVQLASKVEDTGWTINGNITCMENLERFGLSGIIVCTDAGKIYLDGVLKITLTDATASWNIIIGIGSKVVAGQQYIYYITKTNAGVGRIHRSTPTIPTMDISIPSGVWDKSYTVQTGDVTSVTTISVAGNMYFGVRNGVFKMDTAEVATNLILLPASEIIGGFTQFQNSFKIYASSGNTGIQYSSWDGTTAQPQYRQEWANQPILSVVNDGAYDYAILGYNLSYSDLYLISGTQKQELRVNLETSSYSRTFEGFLSIREGIIYISGGSSGESTTNGLYTYGNYYPGTAKSLVQQYTLPSSRAKFTVHSVASSYISTQNSKVYIISHNNPPTTRAVTGYVSTNQWEGNSWEEKTLVKIKVSFKLETASSFSIYLRKEYTDAWQLTKTFDYATYSGKRSATIFENEIKALGLGNLNSLQMKIELIAGTFTYVGSSPIVKRVTAFINVVNL